MKRTAYLVLIMLLVCAFALSACDKGDLWPDNNDNGNGNPPVVCQHSFGDWDILKHATCKEEGKRIRTCSKCSETEESVISKLDTHTEVIDAAVPSTCIAAGLTEGKHCSTCGEIVVTQQETPKLAHVYDNDDDDDCNACGYKRDVECAHSETEILKGKEATCTATGLTDGKKCKKCDETLLEQAVIPMKAHNEIVDVAVESTCTSTGLTEGKHCSVCDTVIVAQTIAPMKAHTEIVDAAVAPTCTATGLTEGKHCSVCDTVIVAQTIAPMKAHTETVDAAVAPTCTATGLTEGKHCSVCDTVIVAQTTVPTKAHTETVDAAVAPTCTATGLTEGKHCSVCDTIIVAQTTVPMKAHTEIVDVAVAPTCTATGLTEGKHCSVCDTVIVAQTIAPMKAHTEIVDAAVAPTCTATGLTEGKHCSVCDTIIVAQTIVPMKAHTEAVDAAVAPTCTATGLTEGKHCSVCNKVLVDQKSVPATGHTEVIDAAITPTCTKMGLTEGRHCSTCGEVFAIQKAISTIDHEYKNFICIYCSREALDFTDPSIYESHYGYRYLGSLPNGAAMQQFYNRLDEEARSFHTDSSRNASGVSPLHPDYNLLKYVFYDDLGLTSKEVSLVYHMLRNDRPLYYWWRSAIYTSEWFQIAVLTEYALGTVRQENNTIIYNAVEEYYAVAANEESEYYIALAYHDQIISNIDYAYKSDGTTPENAPWAHSILGVFTGQGAVCEGYAEAFQLLLNVSDVECIYVIGDAPTPHAWNLVKLDDGNWYWFDLTWDDSPNSFRGITYNYFGITDTSIVDWYDAHLGWQTPDKGDLTFLENHIPDPAGDSYYAIPERSTEEFDDDNILEIRETFAVAGNTYALVGYNQVQLILSKATEEMVIPETVVYNGRIYDVVAIGAMDDEGYFIQGNVVTGDVITEITVPASIIHIDMHAFGKLHNLQKVVLSDGIEEVDHFAFFNCSSLKEITIPSTVKVIGIQALAYCYDLESIYYNGTIAEWESIEKKTKWNDGSKLLTVYCTDGNITPAC